MIHLSHLKKHKILADRLAIFLLLVVVFIIAFIDLAFTKKIKFKPIHGLVMLIALAFILKITYEDTVALGRSQDYAPLQPIKFSHKVHATDNKIDCIYCHHTVESAKSAGIPSTNVCMNCHELVREGTYSGRYEIQKILTHMEKGEAVPWVRIHKLPDHVFFSHAQHAGVGKLDCSECHGRCEHRISAEEMDEAYLKQEMSEKGETPIIINTIIDEIFQIIEDYKIDTQKYPEIHKMMKNKQ